MTESGRAGTGAPRLPRGSPGWDHLLFSAIVATAVVMVTYPVVLVFLRSISTADIGSPLTLEWLSALVDSGRGRETRHARGSHRPERADHRLGKSHANGNSQQCQPASLLYYQAQNV